MTETCKTCRWWAKEQEQHVYSPCRRFPPKPDFVFSVTPSKWGDGGSGTITRSANAIFPVVHEDQWCGEHQPKEKQS